MSAGDEQNLLQDVNNRKWKREPLWNSRWFGRHGARMGKVWLPNVIAYSAHFYLNVGNPTLLYQRGKQKKTSAFQIHHEDKKRGEEGKLKGAECKMCRSLKKRLLKACPKKPIAMLVYHPVSRRANRESVIFCAFVFLLWHAHFSSPTTYGARTANLEKWALQRYWNGRAQRSGCRTPRFWEGHKLLLFRHPTCHYLLFNQLFRALRGAFEAQ